MQYSASASALRARGDGFYEAWRQGRFTPPGAESFEALCARVVRAAKPLPDLPGTSLVVTHGGPIRAMCAALLDLQPGRVVPVAPATATIIDTAGAPRLAAYNLAARPVNPDPPD